jgi:hypothetical protein
MEFRRSCVPLIIYPWKSVTIAFECVVPKDLGSFDDFLRGYDRGATWASFESRPTWPFCDFRPFKFRAMNSGSAFLPLLHIAGGGVTYFYH